MVGLSVGDWPRNDRERIVLVDIADADRQE
jgi:hypothetical protein